MLDKVGSYIKKLPKEQDWYKDRLEKCLSCPMNTKNGAEVKGILKNTAKVLVDEEFGQCSLCGCPVERKCSVKAEKCPKNPPEWEPLEVVGKGSISDYFKLKAVKNIKAINKLGGTFVLDCEDTTGDLFVELDVETSFNGKLNLLRRGCEACTDAHLLSKDSKNHTLKVRVKNKSIGYHRVSLFVTFSRDDLAGRASLITLNIQIDFNKVEKL